jgi:hypothetical protein
MVILVTPGSQPLTDNQIASMLTEFKRRNPSFVDEPTHGSQADRDEQAAENEQLDG